MDKTIDRELLAALKYSGLEKENLAELVKLVTGFSDKGLKPTKVFPYGIPYPDGIRVHTQLGANNLGTLLDLLRAGPRIERVKVFPKGIPFPDIFHVEIGMR